MLKKVLNGFFLLCISTFLYAQQVTVTGVVSDNSEIPIAGVNVRVKGKTTGTTTDFDGKYKIKAAKGDVLIFSNVSFEAREVVVTSGVHNVILTEGNVLEEVIVTAFGIKKKEKELGYSVTQVKAKDLNLVGQTNALEALQGEVAGLQISRSSGSAGGGIDLLIRGVSSIDPSRGNQPLIIIDGLALNNDTYSGNLLPSEGSNSPNSSEQFSFTNRASDINPEDIESYSVLKGAAATALYGIRAANGAIIITTKKGKLGKARVSFSASTTVSDVRKTPELQKTYREGWNGRVEILYTPDTPSGFTQVYNNTPFHTWGPRYSDNSVENPGGNVIDLSNDRFYDPYDLFRTGINSQVNFNISGATEKIDYFFSIANSNDEGILPNTYYDKTNLRFKSGYKASDKFTINTSISFTKSGGSRANGGDKSVMSALSYYSPTFPVNDYYNPADGSQRNFTPWIDNPRYFLEKSTLKDDVNRWVGNATFIWAPKEWLNVTYAAQIDNYSDQRNRFVPPELDTGVGVGGFIVEQNINFTGLESNLLVTMDKELNDNFGVTVTLGNQISDTKRDVTFVRGETLNLPGINDLSNTVNKFAGDDVQQIRNVGVFGEAKVGFKNKLFLTVTGRNDWVSTLPKENRSFFYPSVSLAYDFSDLVGNKEILSFGKLRASWAEVGKGPLFGRTGRFFVADGDFPFGGAGGYRYSTRKGDLDVHPERTQSFEIGADMRFLNNRVRVDYSYFKSKVKSQIFDVSVAPSSGISKYTRNAGYFETNGHELLINVDVLKEGDFKWSTSVNWSTSEGIASDLPDDIESVVFVSSGFAGVTSEVREGDKMGTLYGWKWRYENGERFIGSDGKPRVDLTERQIVGNAFPDFIASFGNKFSYKNFGLNFLLEWKKGGDIYDSGRRNMIRNGTLGITEFRNENTVLEGVMEDPANPGSYIPNTQEVFIDQNYYRSSTRYNRASEILIQDASWLKLRNVGFTYKLGANATKALRLDNLSFSVNAHNILLWTPFVGFDPEGNQYSAGSNVYGFTGLSTPISESYSVGVKLGF